MNGFAALDIPPCRRYVVVKATAGFAVCRLILKLLLFYSYLDFTQNLGKTLKIHDWYMPFAFTSRGFYTIDCQDSPNIIFDFAHYHRFLHETGLE